MKEGVGKKANAFKDRIVQEKYLKWGDGAVSERLRLLHES